MTAPHADQLIDGYLARLRVAAADLPTDTRHEFIDDMRAHIAEARAREPEETDTTILNILDRLGEPDLLAAEARQRPSVPEPIRPPSEREPYRPGILEIAALVLLPFFWPIGVILLWISPAWKARDKVIGTLLPPGGYPGLLYIGLFASVAGSSGGNTCVSVADSTGSIVQNSCAGPTALHVIGNVLLVILLIVLWLLPLVTTAYLAIRLRWGRQPQTATA